jgi:hypothetical protein
VLNCSKVLPKRSRTAQACIGRHGICGPVGGLQQTLGQGQTLVQQPLAYGGAGELAEVARKGTPPHGRARRQVVEAVGLAQRSQRRIQHSRQAMARA